MRRIISTFIFLFFALVAAAQQPVPRPSSQANAPQSTGTIKSQTEVVIEEVTLKDKDGNPIKGLTADDFILTEDGVPQCQSVWCCQAGNERR